VHGAAWICSLCSALSSTLSNPVRSALARTCSMIGRQGGSSVALPRRYIDRDRHTRRTEMASTTPS
jgi:hypothetical protein